MRRLIEVSLDLLGIWQTKFWLKSVNLAANIGFSPKELRKIQTIVEEIQEELLEAWYGYFGSPEG